MESIVDYIIVGQGIAGTLLSYELHKAGKRLVVIDNYNQQSASFAAAAILNPLAGKHWRFSSDALALISRAISTYQSLEQLLQIKVLHQRPLCIFFKSDTERNFFEQQAGKGPQHLSINTDVSKIADFNSDFGTGFVSSVWQVDGVHLLEAWKRFLVNEHAYLQDVFDVGELHFKDGFVHYRNLAARKIIFCQGASTTNNPFTNHLPFTRNRGEALLLRIPDLPTDFIYHHDCRLAPFRDNLFWLGSNYKWQFDNMEPDELWRSSALSSLEKWLKLPFEFVEHIVAERPTTAGQKVFAELHPENKSVAYFNGLGTRGFSAGPSLAVSMAALLLRETM